MNQYCALNKQYIAGVWKEGTSSKVIADRNPFNGQLIAEFRLAGADDIDAAYRSAAQAQKQWAEINAFEKRDILENAIAYVAQHEAEITDIIIDELVGTRLKAFFEISLVKNIIKQHATF